MKKNKEKEKLKETIAKYKFNIKKETDLLELLTQYYFQHINILETLLACDEFELQAKRKKLHEIHKKIEKKIFEISN